MRKKPFLKKITAFLLAIAPLMIESAVSPFLIIGEPQLPKKYDSKTDSH